MKIEEFVSGKYLLHPEYKSFSPTKINQSWIWENGTINTLLEEASRKIATLDTLALQVPDIDIHLKMFIVDEAIKSNKIEGIQSEIENLFKSDSEIALGKSIHSYIEVINNSIDNQQSSSISPSLLNDIHLMLMNGESNNYQLTGEFRVNQNWIGGATLKDAVYIPPVYTKVEELMSDLDNFLHNTSIDVPILIRTAIAHYQFETIHPFTDGNGRIGRLLIALYLMSTGILTKPILCMSDYFEKHRRLYFDNLNNVRLKNDMVQWLKFFLVGIIEMSNRGIDSIKALSDLKVKINDKKLPLLGKKLTTARELIKYLFLKPIITAQEVSKELKISLPTANSLISDFEKLDIIIEKTGWKRNREFEFAAYLDLFRRNNK